jgi:hypothetical protein
VATDSDIQEGTKEGPNDEQMGEHQDGTVEVDNAENNNIEDQDESDGAGDVDQEKSEKTDAEKSDNENSKKGANCSKESEHGSKSSQPGHKSHDRDQDRDTE